MTHSQTPDGGRAFPLAYCDQGMVFNPGMSLRDWFAGLVDSDYQRVDFRGVAIEAYAMLNAREQ